VEAIAQWIAATPLSVLIQTNEKWFIPTVQSVHIAGIGVVLACVLMMTLRVLGYAGLDQSVPQTQQRFGPWLVAALWVLLGTGALLIIGEPERELVTFSFWAKMTLVATGTAVALLFRRSVQAHSADWDEAVAARVPVKAMAVVTSLVWIAVVFLGRFIAYDHIWGPLSPSVRQ
jgi:hypothetical protein